MYQLTQHQYKMAVIIGVNLRKKLGAKPKNGRFGFLTEPTGPQVVRCAHFRRSAKLTPMVSIANALMAIRPTKKGQRIKNTLP